MLSRCQSAMTFYYEAGAFGNDYGISPPLRADNFSQQLNLPLGMRVGVAGIGYQSLDINHLRMGAINRGICY